MKYLVYNVNGEILRFGQCQPETLALQAGENETAIELHADQSPINHYYFNGDLVEIPQKPSGANIFNYATKQWDFDEISAALNGRIKRNLLLSLSDWTQLPDVPLATKNVWATYRQTLRDITAQLDFPININWPVPPQG